MTAWRSRGSREPEQVPAVGFDDLTHFLIGNIGEHFDSPLAAVGPVGVRMRIVGLPENLGQADLVSRGQAMDIVDEATVDVVVKQLRRRDRLVDVLVVLVTIPYVVGALQNVGNPTN